MLSLITKFVDAIRNEGILNATFKFIKYPFRRLRIRKNRRKMVEVLALSSIEDRFEAIYSLNLWGSVESVSGSGSTLRYTKNLRAELPRLLAEFSIKTVFDAPCGDFHWMKYFLIDNDVEYIGGDVVRPLIDVNNLKYRTQNVSFVHTIP